MSYNKNFELDIDDIDMIEGALGREVTRLSIQRLDYISEGLDDKVARIDARAERIQDLLGRIHNQKVWYRPKDDPYISG